MYSYCNAIFQGINFQDQSKIRKKNLYDFQLLSVPYPFLLIYNYIAMHLYICTCIIDNFNGLHDVLKVSFISIKTATSPIKNCP